METEQFFFHVYYKDIMAVNTVSVR